MVTIRTFWAREHGRSRQGYAAYLRASWKVAVLAASWLDEALEKRRSRRALQELSDYQLKDIGLSRADAFKECNRPFWD